MEVQCNYQPIASLQNEDSDIVAKRQNAWILHTIEMHAAEPTRMHYLLAQSVKAVLIGAG